MKFLRIFIIGLLFIGLIASTAYALDQNQNRLKVEKLFITLCGVTRKGVSGSMQELLHQDSQLIGIEAAVLDIQKLELTVKHRNKR